MDKFCSGCGKIKSLNDFRYIKYFDSYRTICIACESKKKKASKIERLKHIKKHGVTEVSLSRIHQSVSGVALKEAKNIVFPRLPKEIKTKYKVVNIVILIVVFINIAMFFAAIYIFIEFNFFTCLIAILAKILFTKYIVNPLENVHVLPVDKKINVEYATIFKRLKDTELEKKIKSDRFYSSSEWIHIRDEYLKKQPKESGYYQCSYCKEYILNDDVTVDHVKPRSKYPELGLDIKNLAIACRPCNSTKGNR